jgi:hypothetical protein
MREVIIHIGLHKTGSTSIQKNLYGYQDVSTRYACFKEVNHSLPMFTIFSKNPSSHNLYKDWGITEEQVAEKKKNYKAQLEYDLNDSSLQRLIISGESISILDADEKKEMLNFFKLRNWNCKILCFVRNHIDWAASAANTINRAGRIPKTLTINTKTILLPFISNLELQNIYVFNFSNLIKNNINVVDFVAKFLNIKIKSNKIANESISLEASAIIYKLNNIPLDFFGYPDRMHVREKIITKVIEFFSLNKGFKKPDPLIFTGLVQKKLVEEDNQWLKDQFGIEFSFNANDFNSQKDISKYFEDALNRIPELLKEFFSLFEISFNTSISLEKNLTNFFIDQLEKFVTLKLSRKECLLLNKKLSPYSLSPELPADFNILDYLLLNPDVLRSNVDPVEHYLIHGKEENRQYNKEFKKTKTTNLNFDRSTAPDSRIRRIIKKYILKLKLIFFKL